MDIKNIVYKKLKNLTTQKFNDLSNIYNIGIDSLDLMELVIEVEKELNIQILDEDIKNIKTIKDIINMFEKISNTLK